MDGLPGADEVRGRIRHLREDVLGATTQGLAELMQDLGVSDTSNASVSRYETRDPLPRADYIAGLALLSSCSADWILFGEERSPLGGAGMHPSDREMVATLAETALRHPPEKARDFIRAIVRIMRFSEEAQNQGEGMG